MHKVQYVTIQLNFSINLNCVTNYFLHVLVAILTPLFIVFQFSLHSFVFELSGTKATTLKMVGLLFFFFFSFIDFPVPGTVAR